MYFCPQRLANFLLCNSNIKLPINNTHYVTGKDLSFFSKLTCIEQTLTNLTCNIKGYCNDYKSGFFR